MGNGRGRKGTAALGAGPWRRVGLALALAAGVAVLATGLWGAATGEAAAAPASTSSLPLELQWVPVLDLSGPVLGVELWGVADPWLAYAGAGWEPEDPTDPHGYERDGLRVRVGTVLSMAPTDTLDLRAMHWPVSWVPGWDGTTGLTVRWVHLGPQHVSFGLGALVGDLWARQETTMEFLRPSTSTRFRALRASLQAPWEIAPDLLAEPKLDLVGGVASQQSGGLSGEEGFAALMLRVPVMVQGFRVEAKLGSAWGGGSTDTTVLSRLGFRAGGWPAELLVRGAAPTRAQAPGRAGLGLTLEREFSLPPPPVQLWLGPDTASYGLLFADWAAKASDFSFRDSESAFAFGVGAGVRGRAGDLQAFLGIEPVGGGAVPRLGARFSSGF